MSEQVQGSEAAAQTVPAPSEPISSKGDRVVIFDTTMRDGEQAPGASMSLDEKLELAKILEEMRVDVIEAGFPIASNGDFEAVRRIAEIVTESTICGLARATAKDIERCAEAIKPARRGRIHTFISTSPVHMKHKLQMGPNAVLEAIGKPASMTSTPISSRILASSSFSSSDMEAPGDCSPSRMVVSKMTTRSLAASGVGAVISGSFAVRSGRSRGPLDAGREARG